MKIRIQSGRNVPYCEVGIREVVIYRQIKIIAVGNVAMYCVPAGRVAEYTAIASNVVREQDFPVVSHPPAAAVVTMAVGQGQGQDIIMPCP